MRKTTEQLARECGDDWDSTLREDKAFMERFRRLAIENERENAEPDGKVVVSTGSLSDAAIIQWVSDYRPRVGDSLFTFPPASNRDAVIEECAKVADRHSTCKNDTPNVIAVSLRALKSQQETPDPRDEALRIAREAIEAHLNPCGCFSRCEFCNGKITLEEALAAIDKAMKGGE